MVRKGYVGDLPSHKLIWFSFHYHYTLIIRSFYCPSPYMVRFRKGLQLNQSGGQNLRLQRISISVKTFSWLGHAPFIRDVILYIPCCNKDLYLHLTLIYLAMYTASDH